MSLTLTRQQLYDRVWSTPVHTLAHELGISDRCLRRSTIVSPTLESSNRLAADEAQSRKSKSAAGRRIVRRGERNEHRYSRSPGLSQADTTVSRTMTMRSMRFRNDGSTVEGFRGRK